MRVIIACAGTGGHINPGIAIADKIKEEEKDSEILFIGTNRGLEQDLIPRAGYNLRTVEAYGLSKKVSIDNLKKMYKTFRAISQAKKIIKEFKPDIVIGTGGYICGPVILAANKLKIPTMLHESNAFPGKAVKMLAKRTDVIMVSFEETIKRLENAKNVVLTGTPTKKLERKLSLAEKITLKEKYALNPAKPTVLAFGGSQGAKAINDAIVELEEKKLNKNYEILLAAGGKQYDIIKENLVNRGKDIDKLDGVKIVPYIYELQNIMDTVEIVVSRSGAITVTEIANIGKPSILIPLPNVSHDHQRYNAEVLESAGAAKIIKNDDLNAEILNNNIQEILTKDMLKQMGDNARKIAIDDVQEKIYREINIIVKGKENEKK